MEIKDFSINRILKKHFKLGLLVIFIDNSYVTDINGKSANPSFSEGIFKIIEYK